MMNKVKMITILIMVTFLFWGCNRVDDEATLEKVIISDTAADVLLMDVQGLEDLDDIDSLITELNILVEEENAESANESIKVAVLEELAVIGNETTNEQEIYSNNESSNEEEMDNNNETSNEELIDNNIEIEKPPVEEYIRTIVGKVQGVSNNKLYIEIVRMKRIDPMILEKLTPAQKREVVNNSIINTGDNIIFNLNEETIIKLQNGSEIKLFNLKIGQLVSVTADSVNNAKEIKLIKLLREPR